MQEESPFERRRIANGAANVLRTGYGPSDPGTRDDERNSVFERIRSVRTSQIARLLPVELTPSRAAMSRRRTLRSARRGSLTGHQLSLANADWPNSVIGVDVLPPKPSARAVDQLASQAQGFANLPARGDSGLHIAPICWWASGVPHASDGDLRCGSPVPCRAALGNALSIA